MSKVLFEVVPESDVGLLDARLHGPNWLPGLVKDVAREDFEVAGLSAEIPDLFRTRESTQRRLTTGIVPEATPAIITLKDGSGEQQPIGSGMLMFLPSEQSMGQRVLSKLPGASPRLRRTLSAWVNMREVKKVNKTRENGMNDGELAVRVIDAFVRLAVASGIKQLDTVVVDCPLRPNNPIMTVEDQVYLPAHGFKSLGETVLEESGVEYPGEKWRRQL